MMPVACLRAADTSDGYSSTIANYAKGDKDDTNKDTFVKDDVRLIDAAPVGRRRGTGQDESVARCRRRPARARAALAHEPVALQLSARNDHTADSNESDYHMAATTTAVMATRRPLRRTEATRQEIMVG